MKMSAIRPLGTMCLTLLCASFASAQNLILPKPFTYVGYRTFEVTQIMIATDGSDLPYVKLIGKDASEQIYFVDENRFANFHAAYQFINLLGKGVIQSAGLQRGIYYPDLCIELKRTPVLGLAPNPNGGLPTIRTGEPVTNFILGSTLTANLRDKALAIDAPNQCQIQRPDR